MRLTQGLAKVTRKFENVVTVKAWKDAAGQSHSVTENRGWYIGVEIATGVRIAVPAGSTEPNVVIGQELIFTLETKD